jgi:5-methylcytosine-specific restriction endonuclease McrA
MMKKQAFPRATWAPVFDKTEGHCTYCGKTLDPDRYGACEPPPSPEGAWEVEHWIPESFFDDEASANYMENLWPACCRCNDEKGDTTGWEYIDKRIKEKRGPAKLRQPVTVKFVNAPTDAEQGVIDRHKSKP